MYVQSTSKLQDVVNKGQRAVIVAVLAKLSNPIAVEKLTEKVVATGHYNGKGTKGHVNSWAMTKAGGDLGSVKYHLRALEAEGRVKLSDTNPDEKPAKARKAKKEAAPAAPEAPAEQPTAEPVAA